MPRMTTNDMHIAADWLDMYEDAPDGNEAAGCRRVAAFLRAEADRRDREALVRAIAREKGMPAAAVRRALAQNT